MNILYHLMKPLFPLVCISFQYRYAVFDVCGKRITVPCMFRVRPQRRARKMHRPPSLPDAPGADARCNGRSR